MLAQISNMGGLQNLILHLDTAIRTHKQRVGKRWRKVTVLQPHSPLRTGIAGSIIFWT